MPSRKKIDRRKTWRKEKARQESLLGLMKRADGRETLPVVEALNQIGHKVTLRSALPSAEWATIEVRPKPIPMLLWCPMCHARHIDEGEFATKEHHTHSCQTCGLTWRPAVVPTVGVQYLPGFKDLLPTKV